LHHNVYDTVYFHGEKGRVLEKLIEVWKDKKQEKTDNLIEDKEYQEWKGRIM